MNVLALPKVVNFDILSKWIESKELVHVDSAFCSSTSRDFLLDMFEKEYFTMGENFYSTACLKYVNNRKIKLKSLFLNNDFGSRKLIHDLTASKVRSLKIVGCRQWKLPRAELVSLFNACLMLSELELDGVQSCRDEVIVQFSPTILSQLTSVHFHDCDTKHFTQTAVNHLSAHCCGLVALAFGSGCSAAVKNDVILKLVPKNTNLKQLSMGDNISDFFPKLRPTEVDCGTTFHVSFERFSASIRSVWTQCAAIRLAAGPTQASLRFDFRDSSYVGTSVLTSLPLVTEVHLYGYCISTHINPDDFNALTSNANLTTLFVNLNSYFGINEDLQLLFERCPKLTTLISPYCYGGGSFRIWPINSDPTADDRSSSLAAHYTGGSGVYGNLNHARSLLNSVPRLVLLELESCAMQISQVVPFEAACKKKGVQMKWI